MSKNILVLTGSARKNGNSDMLADAFIRGAEKNGASVTEFTLADKHIGGCRACNGCWNSKGNCVVKDDMQKLQPLLESADVLVISTPIYWSMAPAQVKAPIDRIYQYDPVNGGVHFHIKKSVLLTCGETDNADDFNMIIDWFKMVSEFNGMELAGTVAVPNVNLRGDIKGNPALDQAEKLGEALGEQEYEKTGA